jgi:penicillin-binding protein 1A
VISKIVGPDGKLLYKAKPDCQQVIDPHIAATVTSLLEGVITGGTGTAANIGRPAAGKTGTAQNFTDAWFVGYVPQMATGVWVGYGYPKSEISMVGAPVLHGLHPFGGTLAAPIWHDFMSVAMSGQPVLSFPTPPPAPGGTVPNVVGMKQDDAVKALAAANFTADVQTGPSDKPAGVVFKQDPAGGASAALGIRVTIWVSNGVAPKVAVPSVVGLDKAAAISKLEAAGFNVSIVNQDVGDPNQDGIVLDQSPSAGAKKATGSTVTITVGVFTSPSPSPSPTK